MELSSSQEAEIPMPLNSAYGGVHSHGHHGHMTHHHHHHFNQHQDPPPPPPSSHDHDHIIPSSNINIPNINNGTNALTLEDDQDRDQGKSTGGGDEIRDCNPYLKTGPVVVAPPPPAMSTKKGVAGVMVRYRECQKNHAASMGGNATDGCGEFMPGGEEGSFEALICSACNCHRNFHRKEIEGGHHHEDQNQQQQQQYSTHSHHFYHPTPHHLLSSRGRKVIGGGSQGFLGYPASGALIPAAHVTRAIPINMPYQVGPSSDQSDDHDHDHHHHHGNGGGGGGVMVRPPHQLVKKRFRTKFSQEQKEKMLGFAEKVGWKIQKQEESVVQQFCQEVGVKRRVLKVWMHNNKHTFANKKNNNTNNNPNTSTTNNNNNNSLLD